MNIYKDPKLQTENNRASFVKEENINAEIFKKNQKL